MKKIALLLILMIALSGMAFARAEGDTETFTSGDFEYMLLPNGKARITGYLANAADLAIPAQLDGNPVGSIGEYAFAMCTSLTSLVIPDGVSAIGACALQGCNQLRAVTLPAGLSSIGDFAFQDCNSLSTIELPDSIVSVGKNPFKGCSSLTKIRVSPDHPMLVIVNGVLLEKTGKRLITYPCAFTAGSYTVPDGAGFIGDAAFYGCESLSTVSIPDTVSAIGNSAFADCGNLTSVVIRSGERMNIIGDEAFRNCGSLVDLSVPESVTSIGENAFGGCSSLTLTVGQGSYAMQYADENALDYAYRGALNRS